MTVTRRAGTTSVATLFTCALTLTGAHWAAPQWAESVGLDVWAVPALHSELQDHGRRSQCLSELIEESHHRLELKQAMAEEMLAGRLTLKEATRAFFELNRNNLTGLRFVLATHEGGSDEEKQARNVVEFAVQQDTRSLFHKIGLVARLEAEFRQTYGMPGPLPR